MACKSPYENQIIPKFLGTVHWLPPCFLFRDISTNERCGSCMLSMTWDYQTSHTVVSSLHVIVLSSKKTLSYLADRNKTIHHVFIYRGSIANIRLVYEVATSHRANLILEYASPPPARRFKWRRKWEVASPCVQIWDATCSRWMTPSSTTVMLGASQGTLLERPPS